MLLTSYPPAWQELAEITTASHRKYAQKHGYDYFADCSETSMQARSAFVDRPAPTGWVPVKYFIKFALLEHFLDASSCRKEYDTVVWLDSDCLITNYDRPLSDWPGEIVTAYDVNAVHPTVIMARNSLRTRGFVWACNNAGRTMFQHHEWSDNECLRYFSAAPPYKDIISFYSAQDLCAMPPGVYPIPEDVRAQYEWTEESFSLHLSALSLEKRVALASAWVREYNLL
jgi:hypothetical protein